MIKVNCSQCGKEFEITSTRFASARCRNSKIFCSKKCRLVNQNAYRYILRQCKECNKEFYPKERNSKFCSMSCAAKYNNRNRLCKTNVERDKVSKSLKIYNAAVKELLGNNEDIDENFVKKYRDEIDNRKSKITKKEIHELFQKRYKNVQRKNYVKICSYCGKEFQVTYKNRNKKCCSKPCADEARKLGARKGGLISSKIQSEVRRSKNEILFANLCKNHFETVLHNEQMFNGWDADVILPDLKIAILWNGKWHYEKIKKGHSVKQVQNRDRIKISEIQKSGYEVYIIQDLGKFNKEFVQKQFEMFLEHCYNK